MAVRITSEWVITKSNSQNTNHNISNPSFIPTYTPLCTQTEVLLLQVSVTMLRRRKWGTTTPLQSTGSQKWGVQCTFISTLKHTNELFTLRTDTRFRMKCHLCVNYIEMQTDPATCDYVIVSGARRKEERWDMAENEQILTTGKGRVFFCFCFKVVVFFW